MPMPHARPIRSFAALVATLVAALGLGILLAAKPASGAEAVSALGIDVVQKAADLAPNVLERFPNGIFFGGQLVFRQETFLTRVLHNYAVFSLQRRFYQQGLPFLILPIRV